MGNIGLFRKPFANFYLPITSQVFQCSSLPIFYLPIDSDYPFVNVYVTPKFSVYACMVFEYLFTKIYQYSFCY